jgi:hypothetical protein
MLHITGLLFLTNAIHAVYKRLYGYGLAFVSLAFTTYLVHQERYTTELIWYLDQAAIFAVVCCRAVYVVFGALWYQIAAIICVATVIYLDKTGQDVWNPEEHKWIHLLSSVGHHAILLGL